uniref:Polymerase acidic protein n=1 Tax=Siamese algae-eater influenza-like virus TaxID=2777035 RepID=A0A866W063_9ORTO|nr:polymerase acidic protein [Siamese algae-eater influenza-like virus]
MEEFVEKTFSRAIIDKAKYTMEEFDEDPKEMPNRLYNICAHLEACYLISNMNYITKEGEHYVMKEGDKEETLRAQFEIIEGLPRSTAWLVVRTLCETYEVKVPQFLPDLFNYSSKRFIEVGITRRLAEDYYRQKAEKLGDQMDIWIFSYQQHHSMTNSEMEEEENVGRVLTRLFALREELALAGLWNVDADDEEEPITTFPLKPTLKKMADESVPHPFKSLEEFRTYVDNADPKGSIQGCLAMMSEEVNVTCRKVTWDDIKPIGGPDLMEGKEVEYNAKFLMCDEFALVAQGTGESMKPRDHAKKCLNTAMVLTANPNMECVMKSEKANERYIWEIWRECAMRTVNTEEDKPYSIPPCAAIKWATGDGLTYEKVSSEDGLADEDMKQEPTKGPEKRKPACWMQLEMNTLTELTNRRALDLPEIGEDVAPIEHVGTERRKFFIGEIEKCKAATQMMKYLRASTSMLTEAGANMDHYRIIPLTGRYKKDDGIAFDCLYGFVVKGKSHLRADTDVMSYLSMEFSLTDPRAYPEKWTKYTVFKIGKMDFPGSISGQRSVFLYCRVNGTNKIKMKWGMEVRRCLLQAMQQMESLIEEESSTKRKDQTRRFFVGDQKQGPKRVTVGTNIKGEPIEGSFGKALRAIFTKVFLHFVFGDSQLEGFSAESRRLMLIIQSLKDKSEPHSFDLEGLYKGINECVLNNPLVLQNCVWMNRWIKAERDRALKPVNPLDAPLPMDADFSSEDEDL